MIPHSGAGRTRTVTPSVNMKEMNLRKTGVLWPVSGEGGGSSNHESAGHCSKESRTAAGRDTVRISNLCYATEQGMYQGFGLLPLPQKLSVQS